MISIYRNSQYIASIRSGFQVYHPQNLRQLSTVICNYTWSPIVWKDGVRSKDNFQSARLMVLDFDGELSLQEAIENVFDGMKCLIGTTRNHQKEKGGVIADRFRVLLWWDRPITDCREYEYQLYRACRVWPADKSAIDGGRLFFHCSKIVHVSDGDLMEVLPVPQGWRDPAPRNAQLAACRASGIVPLTIRYRLGSFLPKSGHRNNFIFALAVDLNKLGFSQDQTIAMIQESETWEAYRTDKDFVRQSLATITGVYKRRLNESN